MVAPWERHRRSSRSGSGGSVIARLGLGRRGCSSNGRRAKSTTRFCSSSTIAVLTLGRQADEGHVLASPRELARRGIEVIRVERGGEVTYHGPGQLVGYPIIRLGDRGILVRPLVAALEAAMIETCARLGVEAMRRDGHPGCWVEGDPGAAGRTARSAHWASGSSAA